MTTRQTSSSALGLAGCRKRVLAALSAPIGDRNAQLCSSKSDGLLFRKAEALHAELRSVGVTTCRRAHDNAKEKFRDKSSSEVLARALKGRKTSGSPPQGITVMAYKIMASQCSVCGACEFECPNAAITLKNDTYMIDPKQCTECDEHFDTPQCAAVCPISDTCVPA